MGTRMETPGDGGRGGLRAEIPCLLTSAPTPFPACGAAGLILSLSHTLDFSLCDLAEQLWAGVTGRGWGGGQVPLKCEQRPVVLCFSHTPQTAFSLPFLSFRFLSAVFKKCC